MCSRSRFNESRITILGTPRLTPPPGFVTMDFTMNGRIHVGVLGGLLYCLMLASGPEGAQAEGMDAPESDAAANQMAGQDV